jgi:hypothetical protein
VNTAYFNNSLKTVAMQFSLNIRYKKYRYFMSVTVAREQHEGSTRCRIADSVATDPWRVAAVLQTTGALSVVSFGKKQT